MQRQSVDQVEIDGTKPEPAGSVVDRSDRGFGLHAVYGSLYDFDATTGALKSVVPAGVDFQEFVVGGRSGAVAAEGMEGSGTFNVNLLRNAFDVDDVQELSDLIDGSSDTTTTRLTPSFQLPHPLLKTSKQKRID